MMSDATFSIDSGLLTLSSLESRINELQGQITATQEAQEALNLSASALVEYLHEFNEFEARYDLTLHNHKITDVGRRIKGVDKTLEDVHNRLSSLQRQIAREIYKRKQTILQLAPETVVPSAPPN